MRKFISLLAAVAVMMTMVVSFATVASATAAPTVRLVVTQAATSGDVLPGATVWNWGHNGGRDYNVYNVSVVYSGLALSATYDEELDDWAGGYKGQSIVSASANVGISSTGTAWTDYRWAWATSSMHPAPTKSTAASTTTPSYSFGSATAVYPGTGEDVAVSSTDDIVLCSFAIAVNPAKPVTLSLTSATVQVGNFDGSVDAVTSICYHFGSKPASSVEYNSAASTLNIGESATVPADESKPVTGITLNPTVLNFTVGDAAQTISPTVTPNNADDPSIDWTTTNSSVATVANGVVTPVGVGTATITATAHDGSGVTATCAVTVSPKLVSSITLDKSAIQLQVGEGTATITATVAPPTATDATVNWTTTDPSVATVAGGVVTPVGAGTATITATANDGSGANASCTVTVKAANPAPVLSQNFTKIDLGDQIENLVGEKFDADQNYGAGRITASIDTVKYDYKVFASDYDDETVTKSWDYAISEAEIAEATINFIAIVKSATHKIGNIWLQAVVK